MDGEHIIYEKSEGVDFTADSSMLGNVAFDTDIPDEDASTDGGFYETEFQLATENPRKRKYTAESNMVCTME